MALGLLAVAAGVVVGVATAADLVAVEDAARGTDKSRKRSAP